MSPSSNDVIDTETIQGLNRELGFRIAEWRADYARLEVTLEPKHLNRSGVLHGGVMATLLDATCGYAGVYPVEGRFRRAVTLTLTTTFLGQTKSGIVSCVGQRRGGGKTVFMANGEVIDEDGTLLAIGEATYRYVAEAAR